MANIPRCNLIDKDKSKTLLGDLRKMSKESHDEDREFNAHLCLDDEAGIFLGPINKGNIDSVTGFIGCPANRGEEPEKGHEGRVYGKIHTHPGNEPGFFSATDVYRQTQWYIPENHEGVNCVIQGGKMLCLTPGLSDTNLTLNQINLINHQCSRRALDAGYGYYATVNEHGKCLYEGMREAIAQVPSVYEFMLNGICEVDLEEGFTPRYKRSIENYYDDKFDFMRRRID